MASDCIEQHRLSIYDRGGSRRIDNLVDVASVTWERVRDSKSTAEWTLSGRSCEAQADIIRKVADGGGRYEVVVHLGRERVWEGPIRRVATLRDRATFLATDVKEYMDHTSLSQAWPNSDGGGPTLMGERIEDIITTELTQSYAMQTNSGSIIVPRWEGLDQPINVLPFLTVYPGTVLTRSATEDFEMMLGEHIDNLVDGGMDFTVVGRRMIFWDSALSIGQTRRLTDADFYGDIEVIRYPSEHWSISHLSASRDDESGFRGVGHAGAPHDFYGVWENIVSMQSEESTDEPTQSELNSQAQRDILHRTPVPLEVRIPDGVGLRLTHDLTIQHLVPGVIMPVVTDRNIQRVTQPQRLDKVKVTETPAGMTVQVSLSPFGDAEAA
ncbi:minor tail protein [Microbacterium phage Smarties]|uniref:Minor tail protein n=1 Tax=Microbacterium phage Ariadne TaxID=2656546 RepID=A0A649VAR2_9CAUD|nr:minor tail protein [Microbacterium phage Ariadne]QGJ89451.1 minor tail protein [Microbacterium phage Ariadne]QGJ91438.1 minor tail protein [Microbacterium phage Smarties]